MIVWLAAPCPADPPVSVGAELSTTIAEIRIERGKVVLKLEVGARHKKAFQDLMALETHPRFLKQGFVIRGKGGAPLPGRLRNLELRPRVERPSNFRPTRYQRARSSNVLYAEIEYTFEGTPAELTIAPPLKDGKATADIGFIVFHEGIQIIDFRFLAQAERLALDWHDPWYSRFENKILTRCGRGESAFPDPPSVLSCHAVRILSENCAVRHVFVLPRAG